MSANEPVLDGILTRYLNGKLSAPVALMQLLIETEDADSVRGVVSGLSRDSAEVLENADARERARELEQLMTRNINGCQRIAAMLRTDMDSAKPARTVEEGIAFCERLFDWSVQQSEEASVALYSLGNPDLLDQATAEIVSQLHEWGLVNEESNVLDIGCGIGRLLVALAPQVNRVVGIDVSAEMVKAARRRSEGYENVSVIKGDGYGLAAVKGDEFDLIIAVDSFPYLRQSGYPLVQKFVADSARALKSRGQLVILNYSYSEDDESDAREVRALCAENGLEAVEIGGRPFQLWDGVSFRLRRP
ncbi:MAG TPA: methyltransferase domain-containing protein [Gemmatimonadaceae bacterium]|nr:methyltransferase domain-containing protein [Gemmatimonadaceae bacterium]